MTRPKIHPHRYPAIAKAYAHSQLTAKEVASQYHISVDTLHQIVRSMGGTVRGVGNKGPKV